MVPHFTGRDRKAIADHYEVMKLHATASGRVLPEPTYLRMRNRDLDRTIMIDLQKQGQVVRRKGVMSEPSVASDTSVCPTGGASPAPVERDPHTVVEDVCSTPKSDHRLRPKEAVAHGLAPPALFFGDTPHEELSPKEVLANAKKVAAKAGQAVKIVDAMFSKYQDDWRATHKDEPQTLRKPRKAIVIDDYSESEDEEEDEVEVRSLEESDENDLIFHWGDEDEGGGLLSFARKKPPV